MAATLQWLTIMLFMSGKSLQPDLLSRSLSKDTQIRLWASHTLLTEDISSPALTTAQSGNGMRTQPPTHQIPVGMHISHDGTIVSVFENGMICLWDGTTTGRAIGMPFRLPMEDNKHSISHSAMSQDGTRFMAFSRSGGMVWSSDSKSRKRTFYDPRTLEGRDDSMRAVFLPDGSRIYVTYGPRIYTIDVDTMEETSDSPTGKRFPVKEFYGPPVISPDGAQFAVLSRDADKTVRLRILDSRTVEEVYSPITFLVGPSLNLTSYSISPDFRYVAYQLKEENRIWVMCIEGGVVQREISLAYMNDTTCDELAFLPYDTGFRLASACDSRMVTWDLVSCTRILGPLAHYDAKWVRFMKSFKDGNQLAVGYHDGAVLVWDISVFDDSHLNNSVPPIAFSSEAACALPQPGDVRLRNVEAHNERNSFQTPTLDIPGGF
ncbi:hypothetical protein PHLCEN_2v7841 [Hermanssonia centrifuga]|uniref:Uncharacterized protein n=1 Tax=Hermanssonia centrifuga TaxID=98765 RepID=A0A2R6NVC7_9APHY|nr:hypothetical protein PHLCEN_2v7841 [Hermanssonia centrifuga]